MKIAIPALINKKRIRNYFLCVKNSLFFFAILSCPIADAQIGTWTALVNLEPNQNMGIMLLMTDGTVMGHNATGQSVGTGWDKLTPDMNGSYVNGTWTTMASMKYDRLFFATQVLPNGKLFAAGGEYGAGDTAGEVYDPVANLWKSTGGVVGKMNIYDGNSEILPSGVVLVGLQSGSDPSFNDQYYTPSTNQWTTAPTAPLNHDEAQWLKLPDSSIIFVGIGGLKSCRFRPQTHTWISDATAPDSLYDTYGDEAGSAVLLPNGKAIFFGATGHNLIYTPTGTTAPGSWVRAPDFPVINGSLTSMDDAPSAMMVNGHILCGVGPVPLSSNDEFRTPLNFVEYDYVSNTFSIVTSNFPGLGVDSIAGVGSYQGNLLDLPDGTVLFSVDQNGSASQQLYVYTPGSGPIAQGKPTINSVLPDGCPNYKITGKLFNGISEGSQYGDDAQNSSNYPLIRLTNSAGHVYYAKTTSWNRIGAVQTDSLEDTAIFTPPANLPAGTYSLVVVANGFASNPTLFTTLQGNLGYDNIACYGDIGTAVVAAKGGIAPYTYIWNSTGVKNATGTGLSAGTYAITINDANGCSVTANITVTQPAVLSSTTYTASATNGCNGIGAVTVSGGTPPYTYSWNNGAGTTDSIKVCEGTYCCTITDKNGCSETTCLTIKSTAGIENINNGYSIKIFPDPNMGSFTVSGVMQGQVIELYNILGQEISSVKADKTTIYYNISAQTDGIYLIRILNRDGTLVTQKKIIKAQ